MTRRHTIAHYLSYILLMAVVLVVAGCGKKSGETKSETVTPVSVVAAGTTTVQPYRDFVVRARAVKSVDLSARVQGYLVQRNFVEGSLVKKGQLLFEIDPREYKVAADQARADLDQAKAKLLEANQNLARGKVLIRQKLISEESFDSYTSTAAQDRAAVEAAAASLEQARLNLSYTRIDAPFDGVIGETNYNVGSLITPQETTPLARVTTVDPMYVTFQVNERDFLNYFPEYSGIDDISSRLDFVLTLSNGRKYAQHGTLNYVDPAVDTDTDTVTMRAEFPNPSGLLRPGMYATMRVTDKKKRILPVVPQIAIQHGRNGPFVYTVKAGKAVSTPVTPGQPSGTQQTIISGLNAGEQVIVQGFLKIRDGSAVKITASDADADKDADKAQEKGSHAGTSADQHAGSAHDNSAGNTMQGVPADHTDSPGNTGSASTTDKAPEHTAEPGMQEHSGGARHSTAAPENTAQ